MLRSPLRVLAGEESRRAPPRVSPDDVSAGTRTMAKIRALRLVTHRRSAVQRELERIRRRNAADFGRADVAWVVRVAAEDKVSRNGGTLREALAALIAQAGSYGALVAKLRREAKRAAKNGRRTRRRPSASALAPFKVTTIVQGGAPGLGGVRKHLKATTTR